jgi:hypothetical protein
MLPSPDSASGARNEPPEDSSSSQATPRGPSWGLMLFVIALAMLAALAIAWAFITPLLHRHF